MKLSKQEFNDVEKLLCNEMERIEKYKTESEETKMRAIFYLDNIRNKLKIFTERE